ncbi:ATP-grasp domain-containing protein [Methylocaldum sp.]|uniref:ATP-grasp domain-containing protein n=1 Tax=Methylocaldum sp. TaxID=1969727 RepID=UPI002D3900BE|nr:ATP-grasp domain-containing protein [Methylocaldum sp.]HYE35994.1 ATP-grasp domain-containing protein [Methylocaldum sp.]
MKILVFEYITGGGMVDETIPRSLAREGEAMLAALLRDLSELPNVRPVVFRDARLPLPGPGLADAAWVFVDLKDELEHHLKDQIERCEAVWPIAPETGGILERLCRRVEMAGKALLTSSADAVSVAASKLATVRRLESGGVPTVSTFALDESSPLEFPLVVKPDDGIGCEGVRIIETEGGWKTWAAEIDDVARYVVQPLIGGEPLSLSVLFAHGNAQLLSCNRQRIIRAHDGFALQGCEVGAIRADLVMYQVLADQIARAMPELWGYAGVDLIQCEQGLRVLEINPRLTTSYAGLRQVLGINPAALILDLWRSGRLSEFDPIPGKPIEIHLEPWDEH